MVLDIAEDFINFLQATSGTPAGSVPGIPLTTIPKMEDIMDRMLAELIRIRAENPKSI